MASLTMLSQQEEEAQAKKEEKKLEMGNAAPIHGSKLPDFELPTLIFVGGANDYEMGKRPANRSRQSTEESQSTIIRPRLDYSFSFELDRQDKCWEEFSFS
mmetsp:Transcript_7724/g.13414  ORF Transcript_7724/g.13414 Transcript_7724/m.13414 type:complete len:101 (-) Transcript_7724:449-751(-)